MSVASSVPTPFSPMGIVYFYSDLVQIGAGWVVNGQVSMTTVFNTTMTANHRIYGVYSGDSDFVAVASNQTVLTVNPSNPLSTTTSLVGNATSTPSLRKAPAR